MLKINEEVKGTMRLLLGFSNNMGLLKKGSLNEGFNELRTLSKLIQK